MRTVKTCEIFIFKPPSTKISVKTATFAVLNIYVHFDIKKGKPRVPKWHGAFLGTGAQKKELDFIKP